MYEFFKKTFEFSFHSFSNLYKAKSKKMRYIKNIEQY